MSAEPTTVSAASRAAANRANRTAVFTEPSWAKWTLITIAVLFIGVMVVVPIIAIFVESFRKGTGHYWDAISDPDTVSALKLTLKVAAFVVPLNAIFGMAAAWAITKFDFRGKAVLVTLIDLPLAVSPVVAGLVFIIMFGRQGYLGPWFIDNGWPIVFAFPGIVLATTFVTFPMVARALIPVMEETGRTDEEAALSLGASGWQTFWRVTLPNARWGLLYGVVLCNARAMGEFGAVAVVSGKITGKTDTLPLRIEKLNASFDTTSAFAISSLLVCLAVITLAARLLIEWRTGRKAL